MKQNEKLNRWLIILALVLVTAVISSLAIINDIRFNDDRKTIIHEIASRDSVECEQLDSISALLNKIITLHDSINNCQKEYDEIMIHDMDTIKQSLNHIKRTEHQILNSSK